MARSSVFFLLLSVFALLVLGVAMLASTSFFSTAQPDYGTLFRQLTFLGVGLVLCVGAAMLDYGQWLRLRWWLLALAVIGLGLCFVEGIGITRNGASRWLGVPFMNPSPIQIQPSEFAKIALVIALAGWFSIHQTCSGRFWKGFVLPGLILALVVGLIGAEVDLGNAFIAAAVGAGLMFLGGTRIWYLAVIGISSASALVAGILYAPNRLERVMVLFDLEAHKSGLGLQQWVSWLAIGSGGLHGRGLGEGRMKLSYLPEAHTDFIFPMVGEELGLFGALATLLMFTLMLVAGMCIASYAPNRFGKLLGAGLTLLLGLEAFLNMGVTTALLPNKGLPLPFVSYGGSSLLAAMLVVGILINIHRQGVHLTRDQLPIIRKKVRYTPSL
jgi:cell division protein FtsW